MTQIGRHHLLSAARLVVGVALIALLLSRGDLWRDTLETLSNVSTLGILAVAAMPIPLILASCVKWQLLLRHRGKDAGLPLLMRFYTIGYFFNNFLPSSFGGDAARSYLLGRKIGSQVESASTVVLERLSGLITLVALAWIGYIATPSVRGDGLVLGSLVVMGCACLVLLAIILAPARAVRRIDPWFSGVALLHKVFRKLDDVRLSMQSFWSSPGLISLTMAYSFGYHALTVLNVFVSAHVLGVELSFIGLCAVTPMILLIAALPTTPGSIGVWEWAYSILLLPVGADLNQGLAIAIILRGQLLFASLVGGVLYLIERRDRPFRQFSNADG